MARRRHILERLAEKFGVLRPEVIEIEVGGHLLHIEIARVDRALGRGLAGRPGLPDDQGLALVLPPQTGQGAISTRGMLFPIDVVFFDEDGAVLGVARGLPPELPPPGHSIPQETTVALELCAGRTAELGLDGGDRVPELRLKALCDTWESDSEA